MDVTKRTGNDTRATTGTGETVPLGFAGGLAIGMILAGVMFLLFSVEMHRRVLNLEKSSPPPLSEKFTDLQSAVTALQGKLSEATAVSAQRLPETKAIGDAEFDALCRKITGGLEPAIAALKSETGQTVAALDAKILEYRTEAANLAEARESQLGRDRAEAVETLRREFYAALEKVEKDVKALAGSTTPPPTPPSDEGAKTIENLRREYQSKLDELQKEAAQYQKAEQERQEKIAVKIEELARQGAQVKATLPGQIEELRRAHSEHLLELGRLRDTLASHQALCDRLRTDLTGIESRTKPVEQDPKATLNSVQFEHLSEEVKTLLARTVTAGSTNIRVDFGKISLMAEASTRDFTHKLVFPETFAGEPIVLGFCPDNPRWDVYVQSVTPESCEISVKSGARIPAGEYILAWVAIGKRAKF